MAILKRTFTICNKCGAVKENVGTNIIVMDEEFYLCDECLEKLIAFISNPDVVGQIEKPTAREAKQPVTGKTCTYMRWDDVAIRKLINLLTNEGMTQQQAANEFRVKIGSIQNIVQRIRESKPGQNLYPYRKYLIKEE